MRKVHDGRHRFQRRKRPFRTEKWIEFVARASRSLRYELASGDCRWGGRWPTGFLVPDYGNKNEGHFRGDEQKRKAKASCSKTVAV